MARKLTKNQKRMVDKYTILVDNPDGHSFVVFRVGVQSFWLRPWDSVPEAKWHQKMVGVALANLVEMETKAK